MRCEQKRYYTNVLSQHKGKMQQTWKVLNECINKGKLKFQSCFKENNAEVFRSIDIANGFNNFFVGVGPSLAKSIRKCVNNSYNR